MSQTLLIFGTIFIIVALHALDVVLIWRQIAAIKKQLAECHPVPTRQVQIDEMRAQIARTKAAEFTLADSSDLPARLILAQERMRGAEAKSRLQSMGVAE